MWSDGDIPLFFNHIYNLHKLFQILKVSIPYLDVAVIGILQVNKFSNIR